MLPTASELFERARQLVERGQFEEALKQFEVLSAGLKEIDDRATVLLHEVDCLCELSQLEEAWHRYRKAAGLLQADDVNRPHLDLARGKLLAAEGKREDALRLLDKLLDDRRALSRAHDAQVLLSEIQLCRGSLLVELYRYREARPALEEVLTFGLDHASLLFYVGICYFELHEFGLAKKYLFEALKKGISGAWEWQTRLNLGAIYFGESAFAKAKLEYERAEDLVCEVGAPKKDRKRIYEWLANICRELGQDSEAKRYKKLAAET